MDGTDPDDMEHNFGTLAYDYGLQPAYIAMKTLIEQLRGHVPVGRIDLKSRDDFVVVFRKRNAFVLAIWTRGEPHEIRLPADLRVSGVVDHLGKTENVPDDSRLRMTDGPRYVKLAEPIPACLVID